MVSDSYFGTARQRLHVSMIAVLALAIAGCQSAAPDPEAELAIELALGMRPLVVFREEGMPTDEPSGVRRLTLAKATELAVMTDPSLQAALARVRIAQADSQQARLLANPILNLVLRWGSDAPQYELSLTESILDAFKVPLRSSAADHRLRQSTADAVTTALDIVTEVQEHYLAAQAVEAVLPLLTSRLDGIQKTSAVVKKRLADGEGVRGDLSLVDAQRVDLEIEIAALQLQQREARLRLARRIGEPSSPAAWRMDPWTRPRDIVGSESTWVEAAFKHRPEIQAAKWHLAALGDDYALTRWAAFEGASGGIDLQVDSDVFIGPSLSTPLPIFDTGDVQRTRATAMQIEARHALTLAKRRVIEEVRVAYASLTGNLVVMRRARRELVAVQTRRRADAEQSYRSGLTDMTPVHLAEQDLQSALATVVELERQVGISRVRLVRAVGGSGVVDAWATQADDHDPPARRSDGLN